MESGCWMAAVRGKEEVHWSRLEITFTLHNYKLARTISILFFSGYVQSVLHMFSKTTGFFILSFMLPSSDFGFHLVFVQPSKVIDWVNFTRISCLSFFLRQWDAIDFIDDSRISKKKKPKKACGIQSSSSQMSCVPKHVGLLDVAWQWDFISWKFIHWSAATDVAAPPSSLSKPNIRKNGYAVGQKVHGQKFQIFFMHNLSTIYVRKEALAYLNHLYSIFWGTKCEWQNIIHII